MANDENVMQLPKKDADKKSSAEDQKTRNWIDQGGKTPVDHIHTLLHVYKLYKIYEQCAIDKICTWKAKNRFWLLSYAFFRISGAPNLEV